MKRINIKSMASGLLNATLDAAGLITSRNRGNQIGPGRRSLYSVHRSASKSRNKGRQSRFALGAIGKPVAPFYLDADGAARAIQRMNRAVRRMQRLDLDGSSIPFHIKRNAEMARKKA